MSTRHNVKDEEFEDGGEFETSGFTYDVSLDDLLSNFEEDEDEPWTGRSRDQARARLKRLQETPARGDDEFGNDWNEEGW